MATDRYQIEHCERWAQKVLSAPYKNVSRSRKYEKRQMNRYIRRNGKKIEPDEIAYKRGRKFYCGWEW